LFTVWSDPTLKALPENDLLLIQFCFAKKDETLEQAAEKLSRI